MGYRKAAITMTLSDHQGHSPTASLFECVTFSYSCAAVDNISADKIKK